MTAASIVNPRTYHPSIDQTPIPASVTSTTTVTREQVEYARQIVQANALSAADRIKLMDMLGLDEVTE